MSDSSHGRFSCNGCGKSYRWKPELAGKKAKCKCGTTMTVPAEDPAAEDDLNADLYALAEDANSKKHTPTSTAMRCPGCGGELAPGAVICVSCGYDMRSGKRAAPKVVPAMAGIGGGGGAAVAAVGAGGAGVLNYGGGVPATKPLGKDEVGTSNLIEYQLPIGLIIFGLLVAMLQATHFSSSPLAFGAAMVTVVVTTIVDLALMLLACFIAAKVMDASFGAPGPALLKLAAISLAPEAVASTIEYFFSGSTGWFVAWAIALVGYYLLFSYLFDLDASEVLILAFIIRMVKFFVGGFIIVALLALVLGSGHGASIANALSGGGSSSSSSSQARPSGEIEEDIANTKTAAEAQAWLAESNGRIFGSRTHGESVDMTKALYAMGASKVTVLKEGPQAHTVVITLPKAKDARKKIFEWQKASCDKYEWEEEPDTGQKYLELDFSDF